MDEWLYKYQETKNPHSRNCGPGIDNPALNFKKIKEAGITLQKYGLPSGHTKLE